jgi:hypothetical protein
MCPVSGDLPTPGKHSQINQLPEHAHDDTAAIVDAEVAIQPLDVRLDAGRLDAKGEGDGFGFALTCNKRPNNLDLPRRNVETIGNGCPFVI